MAKRRLNGAMLMDNPRFGAPEAEGGLESSAAVYHEPVNSWNGKISGELARLDRKGGRAKGAIDPDHPVVPHHRLALVAGKARDDRTNIIGVTTATAPQRGRG